MSSNNKKHNTSDNVGLSEEIFNLKRELEIQRRVAFAEGLFQGDITIRTMLESLAEGVVIIDKTGTIVLANHQIEELFGYNKEEILGCSLNKLIPTRYQNSHNEHMAKYFEKPKIRPMGTGRELKALHKLGHEFPVEISLSHLETTGGQLALAFVTDITLRKEAENSLKSRNEELDAFAHTVAHDLRGSLTPLLGYCELLVTPDLELNNQQIQGALNGVCRVNNKMASVIDELLLLSSVRKEDVSVDILDMRPIIYNVITRLKGEYNDKGFDVIIAEDLPESYGYAPWIEEVWYNFIDNAIKYGGSPSIIELGGELKEDGFACFWVSDNGQGITDEEFPHLFTPYMPRKNNSGSHGLGLSIVKRIVEKLNGEVSVKRILDKGTKFCFTLPIVDKIS